MWDWTGVKNPPPSKAKEKSVADDDSALLDSGATPDLPPYAGYHRDPRIIPYETEQEPLDRAKLYADPPMLPSHPALLGADNPAPWAGDRIPFSTSPSDNGGGGLVAKAKGAKGTAGSLKDTIKEKTKAPFFTTQTMVEVNDESGIWEWQFSMFNLPAMTLVEAEYRPITTNQRGELRRGFKRARRDFLRYISYYNEPELKAAGLDEKGLSVLRKGKVPENYDVHLKIPFEYGGNNEFPNLLLVQTHPFHDDVHKFIDMQTTSHPLGSKLSKLYIPTYEGRVYIPKDSSAVGGGKGKGDKTSVQGFSASALQQMAIKSSMDRGAGL